MTREMFTRPTITTISLDTTTVVPSSVDDLDNEDDATTQNGEEEEDKSKRKVDAEQNFPTVSANPRNTKSATLADFAIYSYSFGNYRGELDRVGSELKKLFGTGVDCYFFTDLEFSLPDDGCKIVRIDGTRVNTTNGIPRSRLLTKQMKFLMPPHPVLEKYRYLVHVDSNYRSVTRLISFIDAGLLYDVLGNEEVRGKLEGIGIISFTNPSFLLCHPYSN